MLAEDGHEVTVLERDAAPLPPAPSDAFGWDRGSVAQFGLGHWMHSSGTAILGSGAPRALSLLREHGGLEFNLATYLLAIQGAEVDAGDERFDLVTGRRSTIEWALATAAAEHPGIDVVRGQAIAGLVADTEASAIPHVIGVHMDNGEVHAADLVVDATGRRSPTPQWLADIGATGPAETSEDSGFAYYGRYFQSADGSTPAIIAPLLTPFESFSLLTLPADNGRNRLAQPRSDIRGAMSAGVIRVISSRA